MARTDELALLRGLLPELYRKAQEGDTGAATRVQRVLARVAELEAQAGDAAPQTAQHDTPRGFVQSPLTPGQDASRLAKRDLDRYLAEVQSRGAEVPPWLEMYDALLDERTEDGARRWDWRKALFIAWSCVPRQSRLPKTVTELASILGLRPSSIRKWRTHDPEIEERIAAGPRRMLLEHVGDVMQALVDVATQPDPRAHQDRKLFLEITGNYQPSGALAVSMTPISYIEVAEEEEDA